MKQISEDVQGWLEVEREQSILSDYVNSMGQTTTTTFGELLRENLQEKLKEE